MKTYTVEIGTLSFEARLNAKDYAPIEKRLKKSIINTLMGYRFADEEMSLPQISEMITLLSGMAKTHGVSERDIENAVYHYLDSEGTAFDLYGKIMEVLEEQGFFGKAKASGNQPAEEVQEMI